MPGWYWRHCRLIPHDKVKILAHDLRKHRQHFVSDRSCRKIGRLTPTRDIGGLQVCDSSNSLSVASVLMNGSGEIRLRASS